MTGRTGDPVRPVVRRGRRNGGAPPRGSGAAGRSGEAPGRAPSSSWWRRIRPAGAVARRAAFARCCPVLPRPGRAAGAGAGGRRGALVPAAPVWRPAEPPVPGGDFAVNPPPLGVRITRAAAGAGRAAPDHVSGCHCLAHPSPSIRAPPVPVCTRAARTPHEFRSSLQRRGGVPSDVSPPRPGHPFGSMRTLAPARVSVFAVISILPCGGWSVCAAAAG